MKLSADKTALRVNDTPYNLAQPRGGGRRGDASKTFRAVGSALVIGGAVGQSEGPDVTPTATALATRPPPEDPPVRLLATLFALTLALGAARAADAPDVSSTVVGPDGQPVAGADVWLVPMV